MYCSDKSWIMKKFEFRYSNVYLYAMEVEIYEFNFLFENNINNISRMK